MLYSLGTLYYDLMLKTYTKMAKVAPNSYRYDQVLGRSYEERQEFSNALVEYKLALKANPQAPGLHYSLGNIYWLSGRYDDARPEFEAELQIDPEDYMSTWKLGNTYLHQRQFDKALPWLQKAIQLRPSLGEAYRDKHGARPTMGMNDYQSALTIFAEGRENGSPAKPNPHYLLASTYRPPGRCRRGSTG